MTNKQIIKEKLEKLRELGLGEIAADLDIVFFQQRQEFKKMVEGKKKFQILVEDTGQTIDDIATDAKDKILDDILKAIEDL